MPAAYLLDTNILVYSYDSRFATKRERAIEVVDRLATGSRGALPAQVLAELANVMLYKMEPPVEPAELFLQIERYEQVFPILPLSAAVVLEAVRGVRDHQFSYFDAQIWAVAKLHEVPVVLSEDFSTGSTVEGVTFLNPLTEDVDLAQL